LIWIDYKCSTYYLLFERFAMALLITTVLLDFCPITGFKLSKHRAFRRGFIALRPNVQPSRTGCSILSIYIINRDENIFGFKGHFRFQEA